MFYVTKVDGRRQPFEKQKIINTCVRMRLSEKQAEAVAGRIEQKLYDGITTKKILDMIFTFAKEYKPEIKHRINLRESISLLRPKPDFEQFVRLVLESYGYEIKSNQLLRGKCVEHEIDGIVKKDNQTVCLEVKHHYNSHTYTGIGVCLEAQATFEDLRDGFGREHTIKFNKAMIVCNTKFSDHAKQYAACKGIELIGWNMPKNSCLEEMIEDRKLYPITFLKNLDEKDEARLADAGIVLLNQLIDYDELELCKRTRIPKRKIRFLKKLAEQFMKK